MDKGKITQTIAFLLVALTPLIFLPFTLNFFATNKQALVLGLTLALVISLALTHLTRKKHTHASFPLLTPLILFVAAIVVNILLTGEARTEGLVNRGSLFLTLPLVTYVLATSKFSKNATQKVLTGLVGVSTLLAIHGILQLIVLSGLDSLPVWMQSQAFTPAGSPLILMTLLIPSLVATTVWAIKTNNTTRKTLLLVMSGVQLAAVVAYISLMLPGKSLAIQLLPLQAGWSLALDALKSGKSLFIGTGLANFPTLFTQAKPLFLNQTPLWASVQQSSSNEILQLLTTTGLLGISAFLILIGALVKTIKDLKGNTLNSVLSWTIYSLLLVLILVPANTVVYTLLFTLSGVAVSRASSTETRTIDLKGNLGLISSAILVVASLFVLYFGGRVYAAETAMRRAQQALDSQSAQGVYEEHTRAISLVPTMANYRMSFSQINLTLASSLSQQESISDQQREQITILVQRAIEEARTATQLRPNNYATWQNLANMYRNLINVATGAENFAIQYYAQAVNLNPASPTLRVDYGGLFFQLAQASQDEATRNELLTRAANQFQTATQLRPTFANGYYNLAKTLEAAGNIQGAYQAMQQVLANLSIDSPDYQTAQAELEALRAKLPQEEVQVEEEVSGSDLSEPEPLPSPLPGGPITLPEDNPSTPSSQ